MVVPPIIALMQVEFPSVPHQRRRHRHGWLLFVWLAWGLAGGVAADEMPRFTFETISRREAFRAGISRWGRDAVYAAPDWHIGKSRRFIAFAATRHELANALDLAEHAYVRAGEWLGWGTPVRPPAYLVLLQDESAWTALVNRHRLRPDGLALQYRRELYFKRDDEQMKRPDRIAHEVVHVRLSDEEAGALPLWLDEGLASYIGWLTAVEQHHARNLVLYRDLPPLDETQLLSFEALLAMRDYPVGEAATRAFYRQAEELVGVLVDRLGPAGVGRFTRLMTNDTGTGFWPAWRTAAGVADLEEDDIMNDWFMRCTTRRTDRAL